MYTQTHARIYNHGGGRKENIVQFGVKNQQSFATLKEFCWSKVSSQQFTS
jgi:hypothetical protein